jgi:hypothetical protein
MLLPVTGIAWQSLKHDYKEQFSRLSMDHTITDKKSTAILIPVFTDVLHLQHWF